MSLLETAVGGRKAAARGGLFDLPTNSQHLTKEAKLLYLLTILAIIYIGLSHTASRYQRVFVNIRRLIDRDPKELANALNPLLLSYLAMLSRLLWIIIVISGILSSQWIIVGLVAIYGLVGPLVTESLVPLPKQGWYILQMERELKKNLDKSIRLGDMDTFAKLSSIDVQFTHAVRKLMDQSR